MTNNNNDIERIARTLLEHHACLILTHINPEGDAIGSMLALALALEQRGISVTCYDRDGVPENCRFLPTWERVLRELPDEIPPLVVYVDADRLERCGVTTDELPGAEVFVRIDHHQGGTFDAGPALVDTTAAAAGEIIFSLLPSLGAELTPDIATNLQAAIMVDTGRFSYSNTTPATHRIAGELVAAGADVPTIAEWTWGRVNFPAAKLLGFALSSLQLAQDGRIAWAVLRQQDFQAVNATPEDTEGIIDHIRTIRDAEAAALFSEKRGVVRVSLRSNGTVDVARIARQFHGGGHTKAAGLTYEGTIEHALCDVLRALETALIGGA
jgi:phosphoesterase RecJ-like protein